MTDFALPALLVASLLYNGWLWHGRRRAGEQARYDRQRYRHCRRQYAQLSKAHEKNQALFRQMRRVTNQPEN